MGLFDKQKCCMCGKEGRLLSEYASTYGSKHLCYSCEHKMHIYGFADVNRHFDNNVSFEALQNYEKYYLQVQNMLKEKSRAELMVAVDLEDIVFNTDVVCFPEYTDFLIPTKTVYAITYTNLPKYSDTFTDAFMVTLFTRNPTIPYYTIIFAGRVKLFSLSTKAKGYRDAVFSLLEMNFTDLKYPIGKAREVKKMVKNDLTYDLPIEKEKLLSWLEKAEYSSGKFNPKHAERKISKSNWAKDFFADCGVQIA